MNELLERHLIELGPLPPGYDAFLAAVDSVYEQADRDRHLIERSLELAQTEKLRAVGQLASGIAHELNTPIQYVGDNVAFLKSAFQTLSGRLARALAEAHSPAERRLLEFIAANVPDALEAALAGCRRVHEIVSAMKQFAHADDQAFAPADINRGILCTLAVAQNAIDPVADVELELGVLPEVECRIGDLNQVFLNLVTNAVHAVADRRAGEGHRGRIHVSTRAVAGRVVIQIGDNGCGIPDAIRRRIFEPFFTTKEVGRGTGQGLAISRSIVVDKHGGALTFDSIPGRGTTFTLELPIECRSLDPAPALSSPVQADLAGCASGCSGG